MEIPNTSKENLISRPWQGLVLGIFHIMGLIMFFFFAWFVFSFSADYQLGEYISLAIAITFFIFLIFLTRGILIGKSWAVIVSLGMTGLLFITTLFSSGISKFAMATLTAPQINYLILDSVAPILVFSFLLYLGIFCLKHPFYQSFKTKNKI